MPIKYWSNFPWHSLFAIDLPESEVADFLEMTKRILKVKNED